jgi:endonuclease/exonuclease/phosphatase family metal-dependent hydrolase
MKNTLLTLILLFTLNIFAQSTAISIDGKFDDWDNLTTYTDTSETLTGIDFLETQITNDNNYLYIRIKTNEEFSLTSNLIPQDIRLYLDTDNNENTGHPEQSGFGSELGIVFQERFAYINDSSGDQIGFSNFIRSAPTITSNVFEIAIDRNFTSNTIKLFWQNGHNNDRLPNTGNFITYTFDETPITQYIPIEINKEQSDYIRICSYNTLMNGMGTDRLPHFEKIIKAISPDIISFQENSLDNLTLKSLLDTWLPLNNSNGWYVNFNTASKWEITNQWTNFRDLNPPANKHNAVLIDLPNSYGKDILIVNAHLICCNNNTSRQQEINGWNNFLIDAKTTGENIDLPENTPIVYLGDLNLVGYSQQLTSLLTGLDENGNGISPDWDNSDLENTTALQTDINMNYSWKGSYEDVGGFTPGKLDYILYTGSVLNEEKSFVLQTEEMPSTRLELYNLEENNTSSASDHFPIVADFSIKSSLSVLENKLDVFTIYPNPTKENLNINFKYNGIKKIGIFNIIGAELYRTKTNQNSFRVNLSNFKNGMYILKIQDEKGNMKTQKIIKK